VELALAYENSDTITAASVLLQMVLWAVTRRVSTCTPYSPTHLATMALAHVRELVQANSDAPVVRQEELEMMRTNADDEQQTSSNRKFNTAVRREHSSLISMQGIGPYLQSARAFQDTVRTFPGYS
jgi:hypothetical protein